jgi:hypothetical protein
MNIKNLKNLPQWSLPIKNLIIIKIVSLAGQFVSSYRLTLGSSNELSSHIPQHKDTIKLGSNARGSGKPSRAAKQARLMIL